MKPYLLYVIGLILVQIITLLGLALLERLIPFVTNILEAILRLYYPMIYLIQFTGGYKGESNMIDPIMLGIPFGILLYSILGAYILWYFRLRIAY
jgi:TctA family transporter